MPFTDLTPDQIIQRMRDPELLQRRLQNVLDASASVADPSRGMTDDQREAFLQLFFMLAENQAALIKIIDHLGIG